MTTPTVVQVPKIDPVPEGVARPFWSVMIPTYNRVQFLEEALGSVLQQDPGPDQMQIEVVDNSTSDAVEGLVRRFSSRIAVHRIPDHISLYAAMTACVQRANGIWVHILHDDDMVLPGFYDTLRGALEENEVVGAAFCRYLMVNENLKLRSTSPLERESPGIIADWLKKIAVWQRIQVPAIVVKREAYERLGGFHPELFHAADWDMWKRIAAQYPVWYEPQPLACYRSHGSSHKASLARSGANLVDCRRSIEISQQYLPESIAARLSLRARENYALWGIRTVTNMVQRGDGPAAVAQLRESLEFSSASGILSQGVWLVQVLVRRGLDAAMTRFRLALNKFLAKH